MLAMLICASSLILREARGRHPEWRRCARLAPARFPAQGAATGVTQLLSEAVFKQ
jgi:hypothetical protein